MDPQEEESSYRKLTTYVAEQHCVLCRNKVPMCNVGHRAYDIRDNIAKYLSWETTVVALGFMDAKISGKSDIPPHVFCFEIDIVHLDAIYKTDRDIPIGFEPFKTSNTAGLVFFIHSACWKLAQMQEKKPSRDDLYNLGLQLSETMPRYCLKAPNPWHMASFASGSNIVDSEWKSLLLKCAQLPVEIQGRILNYVNGNKAAFSLLTGLMTCSLGHLSSSTVIPHPDRAPDLIPNSDTNATHLCASFTNIFGVDYLCHTEILNAPVDCDALNRRCACIEVNTNQICKIEFILGLIGISAVRFYFRDDSKSSWLGSTAQGWRCRPLDVTPQDISLLKNGHKNVLKQLAYICNRHFDRVRDSKELPSPFLWNVSRDLPGSGQSFVDQIYEGPHLKVLKDFTPQAMCSYLPLRENGGSVKGITVYACDKGTNGIIVHKGSSDVAVSVSGRQGLPTSFYFQEGEEIVTLGLIAADTFNQTGPYLLLRTNRKRLVYFGPPLLLREEGVRYLSLTPNRLKQGCTVAGMIVNTLLMAKENLTMFGVHCEPRANSGITGEITPLSERQVCLPAVPQIVFKRWWWDQGRATTAKLTQIKKLRVQKTPVADGKPRFGLRFAGLLVHHTDETIEALGCWDGSLTVPSEIIYDSETDGELYRLVFHLTFKRVLYNGTEAAYYMSNIVAHSSRPRTQQVVQAPQFVQEQPEPEELEPEDIQESAHPAEKTLDCDVCSEQPLVTWCFTEKVDHIEACSGQTMNFELKEYEGASKLCKVE